MHADLQPGTIADAQQVLDRASWPERTIFHLHWEDAIYRHLPGALAALSPDEMIAAWACVLAK